MVAIVASRDLAMIPYDLIIASASRPHLLQRTLQSLFANVPHEDWPRHAILHDDAAFPDQRDRATNEFIQCVPDGVSRVWRHDDPPIRHGPALKWLLDQTDAEYVLYTQDDHEVVRPLPIQRALAVMHAYDLNHIRFNKRDTGPWKETWKGRWYKVPVQFPDRRDDTRGAWVFPGHADAPGTTLTVSDHWYFQTSLWRVAAIKPVVDWFMDDLHEGTWFGEHCEAKANNAMNGNVLRFPRGIITLPPESLTSEQRERDQEIRATYQKTFIWGGIDERAYIKHIGSKPEDWALPHPREAYDGR